MLKTSLISSTRNGSLMIRLVHLLATPFARGPCLWLRRLGPLRLLLLARCPRYSRMIFYTYLSALELAFRWISCSLRLMLRNVSVLCCLYLSHSFFSCCGVVVSGFGLFGVYRCIPYAFCYPFPYYFIDPLRDSPISLLFSSSLLFISPISLGLSTLKAPPSNIPSGAPFSPHGIRAFPPT